MLVKRPEQQQGEKMRKSRQRAAGSLQIQWHTSSGSPFCEYWNWLCLYKYVHWIFCIVFVAYYAFKPLGPFFRIKESIIKIILVMLGSICTLPRYFPPLYHTQPPSMWFDVKVINALPNFGDSGTDRSWYLWCSNEKDVLSLDDSFSWELTV